MTKITSIATALPKYKHNTETLLCFADQVFCNNEKESRVLKYLYNKSGIDSRYSVAPDFDLNSKSKRILFPQTADLEPFPNVTARLKIYSDEAPKLSAQAIQSCITNHIKVNEITHLITVSCTGLSAPGLDIQLVEMMGLSPNVIRTSVNFMGCYAAIHAIKLADAFCKSTPDANVIVVCTELCTLHFQKLQTEDNLTSTLLFGDGSAALLMQSAPALNGLVVDGFYSEIFGEGKQEMAWEISGQGFLMTLSGLIPQLIKQDFKSLCEKALVQHNKTLKDIAHWCIHPGGKKILQSIEQCLSLSENHLQASYNVLKQYGNMSSPTILFVLQEMLDNKSILDSKPIFGAAFGPGLTMETMLLHYD